MDIKTSTQEQKTALRASWLKHVTDWEKKGASANQYCRENDLCIHQFKYWQYRFAPHTKKIRNKARAKLSPVTFIPVEIKEPLKKSYRAKMVIRIGTKSCIELETLEDERYWKQLLQYLSEI